MTPRSFVRTPSVTNEDIAGTPASEGDSGDESLPPHTSEIGTLKKLPNHGTAWLGSSSGVYFVNTVRRAFSAALVEAASSLPASEDILTGEDADGRHYNGPVAEPGHSVTEGDFRTVVLASLGRPPSDRGLAMELVTSFFACWHPLFPFMHGPRFLQDIDTIYAMPDWSPTATFTPAESRRIATFQIIINIASLDRRDLHLPKESRIKSTSDVTRVAGCFSVGHDIPAIQLLIAAELYLVATISLRQASTVAGMILKLIYHAGLHRCPLRYASLSLEDCEIRKRIFWSAYALDRHLSLSLGDPNTVQDNDIDVCLSGRELHKAVAHELIINPGDEIQMHMPRSQTSLHSSGSPADDPRTFDLNDGPQAREKAQREAAMTAYVHYGKLTGRIIEIFHKSIHARFQSPEAITFLSSDIETWWNDLPASFNDDNDDDIEHPLSHLQAKTSTPTNLKNEHSAGSTSTPSVQPNPPSSNSNPSHRQLSPFFLILYHQLQLLLNRPRLSLDQTTAEFQHGLQVCIKASRNTLTALKKHRDNKQSMLLPGLLSATWMAGLIIAFACQLGKYPKLRAVSDISQCLGVLDSMGWGHWFTVKNCHKVLSLLLENIKSRRAGNNGFLSAAQGQQRAEPITTATGQGSRKRPIDDVAGIGASVDAIASPKRKSVSESSPLSTGDFRRPTHPSSVSSAMNSRISTPGLPNRQQNTRVRTESTGNLNGGSNIRPAQSDRQAFTSSNPSSTTQPRSQTVYSETSPHSNASHTFPSSTSTSTSTPTLKPMRHNHPSTISGTNTNTSTNPNTSTAAPLNMVNPSGSALYADPQDMAFARSNHNLDTTAPGATLNLDDPMFWGNFDYNISDIFGAASWENILGGGEMMGGGNGMQPNNSWGDTFGNGNGTGGV